MVLEFTTERKSVSISIDGKPYELREATGGDAVTYRNEALARTKIGPTGKPERATNMGDLEPLLVSMCLYREDNKQVPVNEIKKWPAKVQKKLFSEAQKLSGMREIDTAFVELRRALSRPGCVVAWPVLREYVKQLVEDTDGEFIELQEWLDQDVEEQAKN